jgi:hypothetical protein
MKRSAQAVNGAVLITTVLEEDASEERVPIHEAEQLRNQLTAAIELAKRQSDPFEQWWEIHGWEWIKSKWGIAVADRDLACIIWDAATKAAKEGK